MLRSSFNSAVLLDQGSWVQGYFGHFHAKLNIFGRFHSKSKKQWISPLPNKAPLITLISEVFYARLAQICRDTR